MLDQREVSFNELRHLVSERAIEGETMLLNMGPQHPSTHGVLRLVLELDGETVVKEVKSYEKVAVMTDRLDYLNNLGNNLVYCMAIEKLAELDVPPRAQAIRVILTELQRIASHLVWLGTHTLDLAAISVFWYTFREREMIIESLKQTNGNQADGADDADVPVIAPNGAITWTYPEGGHGVVFKRT